MSAPKFHPETYHEGVELIPLHKWDETRTDDKGRKVHKGKHPLGAGWLDKPQDRDRVRALVGHGHNYGVRLTPDLLVVDVDPRNMHGRDTFAELCDAVGLDPDRYPTVETGSGGLHVFMTKPPCMRVRGALGDDYPGVEFKSVGQQVVAAGSVHPETGRPYAWHPLDDLSEPPPPAPEALLKLLGSRALTTTAPAEAVLDAEAFEELLDHIDPADFPDNASWQPLAMALHDASGGDSHCRSLFDLWCQGGAEYREDVTARWDSFDVRKGTRYTIGTLRHLLRENAEATAVLDRARRGDAADDFDDDLPETRTAKPQKLETVKGTAQNHLLNAIAAVRVMGLSPRFDELKQRVVFEEVRWDPSFGDGLTDNTLKMIVHLLHERFQHVRYRPSIEMMKQAIETMAFENKFNPVTDYLDGLEWDGTRRIDGLFPGYFGAEDGPYERAVSRSFMLGAAARARRPGCKLDEMPVLKGAQGTGKSTGIRALFGEAFFSDAELGDLKGKDAAMALEGVWVHEFAELDGMRRSESSTLKAFLSRPTDRLRRPYDHAYSDLPRRAVFIGTCNESGFLQDGTGNRRFWPLTVNGEVDVDGIARDRDQLWAEADAAVRAGEDWKLPRDIWHEAAERQSAETSDDPWGDMVDQFLEGRQFVDDGEDAPDPDRVLTMELMAFLSGQGERATRANSQRLRNVMETKGWEHSKSVRVTLDGVEHQKSGFRRV